MTTAHRLVDAWARYAALITSQHEALDRDAFGDVGLLGSQREQLAAEIDGLVPDGSDPEALDEIRRQVAVCIDAHMRLRERLEQLRQENVVGTRRVNRWRKALRTYSRGMPGAAPIDISWCGRRTAETAAAAAGTGVPEGTLPAERLLELRRRIQARMHDDPRVVDETVRRMVECGDL